MAIPLAISAAASIYAANKAAGATKDASNAGIAQQNQMYAKNTELMQPWITGGTSAYNNLLTSIGAQPGGSGQGPLNTPFQPTMAQLEQTPGYQFTLNQGLKGVQNSNAARGLAGSGEALAGAANYATGLAGTTYQQQFQNYLSQNQQLYNMLAGAAAPGLDASKSLAGYGQNTANNITSLYGVQGNANANAATATGNAASGFSNNMLGMMMAAAGSGGTGGTGANGMSAWTYPFGNLMGNNNAPNAGGNGSNSSSVAMPGWLQF